MTYIIPMPVTRLPYNVLSIHQKINTKSWYAIMQNPPALWDIYLMAWMKNNQLIGINRIQPHFPQELAQR
jgi:hypothetical protein